MATKKPVKVNAYIQKGRKGTHVKAHTRADRRSYIDVESHDRARRRTNEEIEKFGTRKDPKIKSK